VATVNDVEGWIEVYVFDSNGHHELDETLSPVVRRLTGGGGSVVSKRCSSCSRARRMAAERLVGGPASLIRAIEERLGVPVCYVGRGGEGSVVYLPRFYKETIGQTARERDNAVAQVDYMCTEIAKALGIERQTPEATVNSVREAAGTFTND
jgi:hypothetical protein